MSVAMFLAHLVGDYILQWDSLALWKSREAKGVLAHGLVVFAVTWLFALPFDASWWQGIVFIGLTHVLIDAAQLQWRSPVPPLARFILDQVAHLIVILVALAAGGYLTLPLLTSDLASVLHDERILIFLLGYAFITMPAWVLLKFTTYGLVKGTPPRFPGMSSKYIGILERVLITTFVALGQFLLVPLVAVPRIVMEWPQVKDGDETAVYLAELLSSITLAVLIGLGLSRL